MKLISFLNWNKCHGAVIIEYQMTQKDKSAFCTNANSKSFDTKHQCKIKIRIEELAKTIFRKLLVIHQQILFMLVKRNFGFKFNDQLAAKSIIDFNVHFDSLMQKLKFRNAFRKYWICLLEFRLPFWHHSLQCGSCNLAFWRH